MAIWAPFSLTYHALTVLHRSLQGPNCPTYIINILEWANFLFTNSINFCFASLRTCEFEFPSGSYRIILGYTQLGSTLGHFLRFPPLPEVGSGSIDVDPSLWSTDQVSIGGWTLRFVMIYDDFCVYTKTFQKDMLWRVINRCMNFFSAWEAPEVGRQLNLSGGTCTLHGTCSSHMVVLNARSLLRACHGFGSLGWPRETNEHKWTLDARGHVWPSAFPSQCILIRVNPRLHFAFIPATHPTPTKPNSLFRRLKVTTQSAEGSAEASSCGFLVVPEDKVLKNQ